VAAGAPGIARSQPDRRNRYRAKFPCQSFHLRQLTASSTPAVPDSTTTSTRSSRVNKNDLLSHHIQAKPLL
jgi:hypothetical protein